MPNNLQEHISYTNNEWCNIQYYIDIITYLESKKIKSFIDLDGCTGEVSIIFNKKLKLDKIYIIEPIIENFNFISKRIEEYWNIFIINKAIYYGNNFIELGQSSDQTNVGGWSFSDSHNLSKVLVETITLEDLPICDAIKIDIEGSEENLIMNSQNLKKYKFILLELHGQLIYNYLTLIKKYLPNHIIRFEFNEQIFLEKVIQ